MTQELLPQFTTPRFALRSLAVAVVVGLLSVGLSPQILAQDPGSATVPPDVSSVASAKGEASAKEGQTKVFDIPAGKAEQSLKKFSEQSGLEVLFPTAAVRGVGTNAVKGDMTPNAALDALLSGTELVAITDAKGGLTIRREKTVELAEKNAVSRTSSDRAADQDEKKQDVVKLDTFEVFGKKTLNMDIQRTADDSQPYVVFDRRSIELSGTITLQDFLKTRLSANINFLRTETVNPALPSGGIDLRGLGSDETLILVDGRRVANAYVPGQAGVQGFLNNIPLGAIERVEVLPVTASGIYGGGATGGAVNIILRRNYHGAEIKLTYQNSFDTDSSKKRIDFSGGFQANNGKTSLMFYGSVSTGTSLSLQDTPFWPRALALTLSKNPSAVLSALPPPLGGTTNIRSLTGSNLSLLPIYGGTVLSSPFTSVPVGYAGVSSDNGAGLVTRAGQYNLNFANTADSSVGGQRPLLWAPDERSISFTFRHDFTKLVSAFVDASYSTLEGSSPAAPTQPFVLLPGDAGNPFNEPILVSTPLIGADRKNTMRSDNLRTVVGAIVELPRGWKGEADGTMEINRFESISAPSFFNSTVSPAVSSGLINVFRDTNVFPTDFGVHLAPAGITPRVKTDTWQGSVRVAGPLPMPGALPAVMVSASANYREESYGDSRRTIVGGSQFLDPARSQTVDSYYLEARWPLYGKANAHVGITELELTAAARYDHYVLNTSTSAILLDSLGNPTVPVVQNRSRKESQNPTIGLRYKPTKSVLLRASYATGFLPPNLVQAGSVRDNGFVTFGAGRRDPARGLEPVNVVHLFSGGNPSLRPETTRSLSAGLVFTPSVVPGLRASVDWVSIEKHDAITLPALGGQANFVRWLEGAPELFVRAAPSDGFAVGKIVEVHQTYVNIAQAEISAVDYSIDYERVGEWGKFSVGLRATNNQHLKETITSNVPSTEIAGFQAGAKWRGMAEARYERGPVSVSWTTRYVSRYFLNPDHTPVVNQGAAEIADQWYHDIFCEYRLGSRSSRWARNVTLGVGVQNVFHDLPPTDLTQSGTYFGPLLADPRVSVYTLSLRKAL